MRNGEVLSPFIIFTEPSSPTMRKQAEEEISYVLQAEPGD